MHNNERILEIDGLRGIAVLSVVVLHWVVQPNKDALSELGFWETANLLAYGVDLFFIVSGYLIGGILFSIAGISGLKSFYIRRALRIYPLYYLLLGASVGLTRFSGQDLFSQIPFWSFPLFIFNFWESFKFAIPAVFSTLWSLAIEEQFYLIGPVLFIWLKQNRGKIALLSVAYLLLAPFIRASLKGFDIVLWRFTPARLDGICMGIFLAALFGQSNFIEMLSKNLQKIKLTAVGLSIATVALVFYKKVAYSLEVSLVTLTLGLFMAAVLIQSREQSTTTLTRSSLLRYLGKRCYSIYLYHVFFGIVASVAFAGRPIIALFAEAALTIGFAHFAWKYIEYPLIAFGKRYPYEKSIQ